MVSKAPKTGYGRQVLLVAGALLFAIASTGCEAVDNLTEPEVPTVDRTLSLSSSAASVPEGGGEVEFVARVTSAGTPEVGTPVTFDTTAGEFIGGNTATTDGRGDARRILRTSEPAKVTAKVTAGPVVVASSNDIEIKVGGPGAVTFDLEVSPNPAKADSSAQLDITATREDGSWASGLLIVEFGDGASKQLPGFNGQASVAHVYREASVFNVRLRLQVDGIEVARSFQLRVKDGATTIVELSAAREEVSAREPLLFTVRPRTDTGRQSSGKVRIDWGDGRATNLGQIAETTRLEHTYRDPGSYRVVADLTDSSGRSSSASLRIRVLDPVTISGSLAASDSSPTVGESVNLTFTGSRSDGRASSGTVSISFGDGDSTTASVSNSRATVQHTWAATGSYTVRADFSDGEGHSAGASLAIAVQAVGSGGGGGGGGGDGGSGGGGGGGSPNDELDVSQITWLHSNASNWNVTSTVKSVSVSDAQICIDHTKAGSWPVRQAVEGNPWVVAKVNGTWYAATYEWLRPGQICKALGSKPPATTTATEIGPHIKVAPLSGWVPKSGEVVYFFVSTHARAGVRSSDERSNLVRAVWP